MGKKARNISSRFWWLAVCTMIIAMALVLSGPTADVKAQQKGLVDLNTASEKELEGLKGVGPAYAKKIIAGRPYKSVDELSKTGIPVKTIEGLKPFVTVSSAAAAPAPSAPVVTGKSTAPPKETATKKESKTPTAASTKLAPGQKVNINTASKEQLEALPEIGPVKAQAIIDGRPYKTIEDIKKVKGIKEGIFNKIKDLITVQ
jgi:competence protein ComEA